MDKKVTKKVMVGDVAIGGKADISVQSMLSLPAKDVEGNIKQALDLEKAGCDILRVAIPDMQAIKLIDKLKEKVKIPIVADIHFDYRLALEAAMAGADKIRLNPGNIGDIKKIKKIAKACKLKSIPIRIGVNSGSLEKNTLEKYGGLTPQALCESALYYISLLENLDFFDIIVSVKASNVETMVCAYELISERCDYPLHLGVTEAGTEELGILKSSIGIGALLLQGIGDTVRVSLTANPLKEVIVAKNILKALKIDNSGIHIVSCPTCGRTKVDLIKLVSEAEKKLERFCDKSLEVAIMGCEVNGPGEAREADIGIACGDEVGVLFKHGKIIKKVNESALLNELLKEVELI